MLDIAYFSNVTEYTHRFVNKLDPQAYKFRIPIKKQENEQLLERPYLLIVPTYKNSTQRAVPPQVVRFLNQKVNRDNLVGIVGAGNTNFNKDYCLAAYVIAHKTGKPVLHTFELLGNVEDVNLVNHLLEDLAPKSD